MAKRKLRVLALHSFRTNAQIFQDQFLMAGLDKSLSDLWEPVRRQITSVRITLQHTTDNRASLKILECGLSRSPNGQSPTRKLSQAD